MCVDFVSLSVKDQRARFLFCEEFWWHSTQSRQIQQIFYQLFTMGTHLTDLPPAKEFLAKCNISIISYLTSRSPAQTKGLDCLCYCEPRTLKQAALSIMGTCVTYFYQHTYNGDLFNRFTSGVILSYVWGWQTRQWDRFCYFDVVI